jgi:hypothetical protein
MNSKVIKISLFVFAAVAALAILNIKCTPSVGQEIPDVVDYNFHVRPILSDRCFACHGPDEKKREANLRLDTEEGAYAALEDNPKAHAIVKGNPEASEVYKRITSTDTSLKMPPPSSNLTITEDEIKRLYFDEEEQTLKFKTEIVNPVSPVRPDMLPKENLFSVFENILNIKK